MNNIRGSFHAIQRRRAQRKVATPLASSQLHRRRDQTGNLAGRMLRVLRFTDPFNSLSIVHPPGPLLTPSPPQTPRYGARKCIPLLSISLFLSLYFPLSPRFWRHKSLVFEFHPRGTAPPMIATPRRVICIQSLHEMCTLFASITFFVQSVAVKMVQYQF